MPNWLWQFGYAVFGLFLTRNYKPRHPNSGYVIYLENITMSTTGLNLASFAGLGNRTANSKENPSENKQEDAEFWLNIGYQTTVATDDGDQAIFVSLARGIPLDQIKEFDVSKSRTQNMAALRDAQNQLHSMFMTEANKLAPGEDKLVIIDETTGLSVQMKRVKGAVEAPTDNTLTKAIAFRQS